MSVKAPIAQLYEPPMAESCCLPRSGLSGSTIRYCSNCHLSTSSHPFPSSVCPRHESIFIRCAGYCSSDHSAIPQSDRVGGVGVFFGLFSKRNVSECVPKEFSLSDSPVKRQEFSTERMEVWSCIRALDKVLEMVKSDETVGLRGGRIAVGVKEVVLMMASDYVIGGMTSSGRRPWEKKSKSKEQSQTGGAISQGTREVSIDSTSSSGVDEAAVVPVPQKSTGWSWFGLRKKTAAPGTRPAVARKQIRRRSRINPRDYDLFKEIDRLAGELAAEHIQLLFWKVTHDHHGGATRLAKEGAVSGPAPF